MSEELLRQVQSIGKGVVQANLRLNRVIDLMETGERSGDGNDVLQNLLELLDAVTATIDATSTAVARKRWWRWPKSRVHDLTGLRLARDAVVERLEALGIDVVPREGLQDPRVHCVIATLPTSEVHLHGTIARTHRVGWVKSGEPPTVLRQAHVTTWRHIQ